jgi:hypothetical protein
VAGFGCLVVEVSWYSFRCFDIGQGACGFFPSHAVAFEGDAVGVVDDPVEDGICDGWRHRTQQSTTLLDRVVSDVTVTDPQHSLFGSKLVVLPERSGRGPAYIVVQLADGRRRSIRVSSTDLGGAPIASDTRGSAVPRISVRTLIPLTRHLNASLALHAEEVIRNGPTSPSRTRCVSAMPAPSMRAPSIGGTSTPVADIAGRDSEADSPGGRRIDTPKAGRLRPSRKGDHPC